MDEIGIITKVLNSEVKLKRLSEVATVQNGRRVTKSTMEASPGKYTVWHGGEKPMGVYSKSNCEANTTLIANTGSIGYTQWTDEACWCSDACTMVKSKDTDILLDKYIYYYLMDNNYTIQGYKRIAGIPTLDVDRLRKFRIPIPPIEVQAEIVRILDTFTELIAELIAELTARKKQYEFYRDELLGFEGRDDVEWKKLGEVFELRGGYTPSKQNDSYWDNGDIPWFRLEDIRDNGGVLDKSIQKVTRAAIKGKGLFKANSIIITTSATIGVHALIKVPFLVNQRFISVYPKSKYEAEISMKFMYYYFFIVGQMCKESLKQGNFSSVDMDKFNEFEIPIPSLAEQERIVSILDQFDTLTNSLTEGIPAEIELRQKQYEFYREKLLTFKRRHESYGKW